MFFTRFYLSLTLCTGLPLSLPVSRFENSDNGDETRPSTATSSGYTTAYRILASPENISERQRRLVEWPECYAFDRVALDSFDRDHETILFIVEFVFEGVCSAAWLKPRSYVDAF